MLRYGILVLIAVLLIGCGSDVGPAADISIEVTPERLARGEYLAESVAGCVDCHSIRDWNKYSAPVMDHTRGGGGEVWDEEHGFPGTLYAPNITPYALADWSDGEIIRAFTEGLSKDDRPLFPLMPYYKYGQMSTEDIYSIVAYIRTLDPIENTTPESKLNFPLNVIVKAMPAPAELKASTPQPEDPEYGAYMTNAAVCGDCHTPTDDKGRPLEGMEYAGGFTMIMHDGMAVNSSNLTPHETGLGAWSRQQFIDRFKALDSPAARNIPMSPGQNNTIMPWTYYATMTAEDLGAIYDYLSSLKPVDNAVVKYPDQTL